MMWPADEVPCSKALAGAAAGVGAAPLALKNSPEKELCQQDGLAPPSSPKDCETATLLSGKKVVTFSQVLTFSSFSLSVLMWSTDGLQYLSTLGLFLFFFPFFPPFWTLLTEQKSEWKSKEETVCVCVGYVCVICICTFFLPLKSCKYAGVAVCLFYPSTGGRGAETLRIRGQPGLHSNFQASQS